MLPPFRLKHTPKNAIIMDDKERLTAERRELDVLTDAPIIVTIGGRRMHIAPPTLAVLDELAKVCIDFPQIDITGAHDVQQLINECRADLHRLTRLAARAVAVAVVGERGFGLLGRWLIRRYARRVRHSITPQELGKVFLAILRPRDLVDFISSMQLMSIARTTRPIESIE